MTRSDLFRRELAELTEQLQELQALARHREKRQAEERLISLDPSSDDDFITLFGDLSYRDHAKRIVICRAYMYYESWSMGWDDRWIEPGVDAIARIAAIPPAYTPDPKLLERFHQELSKRKSITECDDVADYWQTGRGLLISCWAALGTPDGRQLRRDLFMHKYDIQDTFDQLGSMGWKQFAIRPRWGSELSFRLNWAQRITPSRHGPDVLETNIRRP